MTQSLSFRDGARLVLLSFLWGGTFFLAEVALRHLGPFSVVAARVMIGAIALVFIVRMAGQHLPRTQSAWRAFLVMGLLNNVVPFSLIFWGQTLIDSSLAAILNATTPMFSVVLAHFVSTDENLTGARILGVALGIAGVACLVGPDALTGLTTGIWGQAAVLGAALSYAVAAIYGRRRLAGHPPLVNAAGQVISSAFVMVPLCMIVEAPWQAAPDAATLAALFAIGVFSTAFAYALYFQILKSAGATNLMLVTLLIPLTASALGVLVLGEVITPVALLGMALILFGLVAIDGRALRRLRR